MQRYFVDKITDNKFTLSIRDSYHCKNVMRSNINDSLEIVCNKKLYSAKITNVSESVNGRILKEQDIFLETKNITIAQALVTEQKMDLILQKSVELGVNEIIPLITERSIIKVNKDFSKKVIRWQKIASDASSQSKRLIIPNVTDICNIKDLVNLTYDYKFLCSVNEKDKTIKRVLQNIEVCDRILFVIGPEGGLTNKEEDYLTDNGFIRISLGNLVLRTETASMAILSMINYHFMR